MREKKTTSNRPAPPAPIAADRRRSPRFADHLHGDETVEIWLDPARPRTARILDESLEGVGLMLHQPLDVSAGERIDVIYRGVRRRGRVRDLSPASEGTWRLGLQWLPAPCDPRR